MPPLELPQRAEDNIQELSIWQEKKSTQLNVLAARRDGSHWPSRAGLLSPRPDKPQVFEITGEKVFMENSFIILLAPRLSHTLVIIGTFRFATGL